MVRVKTEEVTQRERCERILVPLRWIAKLVPVSSFIVIAIIQGLFPPAPRHLASPNIV